MAQTLDYAAVGLIVGLEVHQQLHTERKLFCNCPCGIYHKEHDGSLLRHMRPTLSELGVYDGTALMEFKTRKNIIYLLHKDTACTYEMDDTPPFLVNQDALDVAIEQCLMLGCDIIDEVHFARKQYLDGSIPTGFQRTAIVGMGGKIPFRGRELSITQISVEEDSCREVSDNGHLIVWRTDRLGIPLIETVTGPDLRTPEEVEEAILLIGRVCRSTGHVRTGMGASRQDINVSVRGGRRVEIKGVPFAWLAPALVHGEAVRQVNLLKLRDELHARGFKQDSDLKIENTDVTKLADTLAYPKFHQQVWKKHVAETCRQPDLELGSGEFTVRAVKLTGLSGTLNWQTQPDHVFADELKGRVRVISGLDLSPILLSSENWPSYDGSENDLAQLKEATGCGEGDSLVVVWGPERDTLTAAQEIRLRYSDATDGIPNETRQPKPDGSTDFERILPGPDRMYPDTDSPPTRITRDRVTALRDALPEVPWSREKRYLKADVPLPVIHFLIRRNGADLVDLVVNEANTEVRKACFFFGAEWKSYTRKGWNMGCITPSKWVEFFKQCGKNRLVWEARVALINQMVQHPEMSISAHLKAMGVAQSSTVEVDGLVTTAMDSFNTYPGDSVDRRRRFAMGSALYKLRGQVCVANVQRAVNGLVE